MLLLLLEATSDTSAPDCGGLGGSVSVVTKRRRTGGGWDYTTGLYTQGSARDSLMCADVQPRPGTTTTELDDGSRSPDQAVAYIPTTEEIRSVDQHGQAQADRIFVPRWSAWYEVQAVYDAWGPGMGLSHRKITMVRLREGQDP